MFVRPMATATGIGVDRQAAATLREGGGGGGRGRGGGARQETRRDQGREKGGVPAAVGDRSSRDARRRWRAARGARRAAPAEGTVPHRRAGTDVGGRDRADCGDMGRLPVINGRGRARPPSGPPLPPAHLVPF